MNLPLEKIKNIPSPYINPDGEITVPTSGTALDVFDPTLELARASVVRRYKGVCGLPKMMRSHQEVEQYSGSFAVIPCIPYADDNLALVEGLKIIDTNEIEPDVTTGEYLRCFYTATGNNVLILDSMIIDDVDRLVGSSQDLSTEYVDWVWEPIDASPFDRLLFYEDQSIQKEIDTLRHSNFDYSESLAQRLEYLISVGYEDDPDVAPLKVDSVHYFLQFLYKNTSISRPNVVLTPNRTIQAQWGKERDKKLVVEFLSTGTVNFVLFISDQENKRRINRLSGNSTTVMLLSMMDSKFLRGRFWGMSLNE